MGRAAFLALAIALAACASKPPVIFGERMPAGCTKTSRSERCFGWIFDRTLMAFAFKPYHDEQIRAYVASIGARIAMANHDKRRWTFRVLDDDIPQAYAGFNATIYITRGALAILRDEAELAAVIAHEMGHTIAGHHREAIAEMVRDVGETELQKWRDLRYARDDEIQADEQAVVFLARAGYDVNAVERMLRALGGYEGGGDEDSSDDRHPVWRERIARAAALATRHPAGERAVERYNARVAALVIGEDPKSVAVLGTVAVFGRAGFAVELPAETKSFVFRGMVMFVMPNEIVGTAQLIDRRFVKDLKNTNSHTEVKLVGDQALAITIVKDEKTKHADRIAKSLVAKSRTPRVEELARLHPVHFDPTKPRAIWAP
jgi:predicted Zn-dependent protease